MKPRVPNRIFIAAVVIIFIVSITIFSVNSNAVVNTLKVSYIDVGQADSILIQSNGSNMLIDAGNRGDDTTVINYLKKQGVKKLDIVIGTHPHEDHIGGMGAVIKAFAVGKIIMPKVTSNTKTFKDFILDIKDKGLKISTPVPGASFKLGGSTFKIVAPNSSSYEDLNNYSVVIKLTYGKTSFMFSGDAESESEQQMLAKGYDIKADVLKLGHHGSRTSTTQAFLNKVNPKYAIISSGSGNDYGHPNKETIKKLVAKKITFYRTDINKTIICTSDGKNITFKTTGSSKVNNTATTSSSGNTGTITTPKSSTGSSVTNNKNMVVYVTKSGKKYHRDNCSSLSRSKIAMSLKESLQKGYTACKICKPPTK